MSVATKVIVAGSVVDVTSRSGTSRTTGEVWQRRTALVFGSGDSAGVVAEVAFRDASATPPNVGDVVKLLCEVGVYRDDDTLDFVRALPVNGK